MMEPPGIEESRPTSADGSGLLAGWRIRVVALVLLVAITCGVVAAPLAFLYRWYESRQVVQATQTAAAALRDASEADASDLESVPAEEVAAAGQVVQRIAYITPDQQLATINGNGRQRAILTDSRERFQFPAWSPDGGQLAVIGGDSVYAIEVGRDGEAVGPLRRLYSDSNDTPFYLYWSPDSQAVTFLTNHPDGIALYLAGAGLETGASRLLSVGQPFYWNWLPESNRILIHSGFSGEEARLAVIDPAGINTLSEVGDPGFFQAPGVSPSGRYWAFAELNEDEDSQLVVSSAAGERLLTETHLGQLALNWSPHDDLLAFMSPTLDSAAFYGPLQMFDPVTGRRQTLSSEVVIAYFWSPDGQRIAYLTLPGGGGGTQVSAQTYRTSFSASAEPGLVQDDHLNLDLWTVDIATGFNRRVVSFDPTRLFVSQFLPYFDQYALSHRIWAPDSRSLILPMLLDGRSQIVSVDVVDGTLNPVADGIIGFWSHQ